ncbi:hypothetical protein ACH61_03217 [Rathayibacter tanaceti]|uniref:Uncharacterized protein n=1 Tax=Rathayibacter tanaceti TaxID=1671680 RepID=A0A162IYN4_9MICO|nr:hypothetical protein ACH61_03217 [Rathayibacter tanaceti]
MRDSDGAARDQRSERLHRPGQRQHAVDHLEEGGRRLDGVGAAGRGELQHDHQQRQEPAGRVQQRDQRLVDRHEGEARQHGDPDQPGQIRGLHPDSEADGQCRQHTLGDGHQRTRQVAAQRDHPGGASGGEQACAERGAHQVEGERTDPERERHEVRREPVAVGRHPVQTLRVDPDGSGGDRAEFIGLLVGVAGDVGRAVGQLRVESPRSGGERVDAIGEIARAGGGVGGAGGGGVRSLGEVCGTGGQRGRAGREVRCSPRPQRRYRC